MTNTIRQRCIDENGNVDLMFFDGFDDAIVGICHGNEKKPCVVYDEHRCIDILMETMGLDTDSAIEFFQRNLTSRYLGPQTGLEGPTVRKRTVAYFPQCCGAG